MFLDVSPLRAVKMVATFLLPLCVAIMQGEPATPQTSKPVARLAQPGPLFPLSVSSNRRYLVDSAGKPFLIHGDTAWSLIAQLRRDDVERYLDDRKARGFNAILVNLLEHRFSSNPPANVYGQPPFLTPGDFSTPNEEYFAYADWVLQQARERGFLVLLAPAYIGSGGGSDGWYQAMLANEPKVLHNFGEYVGNRFRDFRNILWVHGGDYNPPRKELVRAIADGIRTVEANALHTAHTAPETSAIEYWTDESWLQVNNIFTYQATYLAAFAQYERHPPMPFFLIESAYENEHRATALRIRTQVYQALLSGAAGHIYGNNPVWHFDGPGLYPVPIEWDAALGSAGAKSMTHVMALFSTLDWWELEPDVHNTFLLGPGSSGVEMAGNLGSGQHRAVAARAHDGSFGLVYLPVARQAAIDLTLLSGPEITARWYDPATGTFTAIPGSLHPAAGKRRFNPPVDNGKGLGDWVLVLQSRP